MEKSLTLRLTEIEVKDLDKIKAHLKEKTYNKAILQMMLEYIEWNQLKEIVIKEPDYGTWSDVKQIRVGKDVNGLGSDLEIEFNNGTSEGYNLENNGQ